MQGEIVDYAPTDMDQALDMEMEEDVPMDGLEIAMDLMDAIEDH